MGLGYAPWLPKAGSAQLEPGDCSGRGGFSRGKSEAVSRREAGARQTKPGESQGACLMAPRGQKDGLFIKKETKIQRS